MWGGCSADPGMNHAGGEARPVPVLGTAPAIPREPKGGTKCVCCTREVCASFVPPLTPVETFALSGPLPALEGKFELHKNQLL